jgi:hypothetical protein
MVGNMGNRAPSGSPFKPRKIRRRALGLVQYSEFGLRKFSGAPDIAECSNQHMATFDAHSHPTRNRP